MENAKQFSVGEGTSGEDSKKKQLFPITRETRIAGIECLLCVRHHSQHFACINS